MLQKTVATSTSEETARIFGSYDANARQIEKAFSVTLHNRATDTGDSILISGEEDGVKKAAQTVEYLKQMAAYNSLTEQSVGYVIDMIADGRADELSTLDDNCICITNRGKPIKAKTVGQKKYVELIRKNTVVLGVGPAGTGKTFLAVAMAVKALRDKQVNRIILTRPAVEAGEKLGFLPGDLQNKIDPYLRPLYDALFEMMGAENYARCLEKQTIEIAPLAYMRGRTLDDSFIILDEAQNATPEQMKMFLTRLGYNSKIVVTGDLTQTDLPDGKKSGLAMAVKILRDIEDIGIHTFTERDVVRHKLVQKIILAYEKFERTAAQHKNEPKRYHTQPRRDASNQERK
ncbi:MAG: PhoH family protein [Clostridia bacterium]|nr:PhoH family protein [Clostridia bacterium]